MSSNTQEAIQIRSNPNSQHKIGQHGQENNKTPERLQRSILQQQRDKNLSVKVQLKEGAQIIQQKGRPIPIQLQDQVALELKRLIKHEYIGRAMEITEDCFVSPAVLTVKKDKSIKIALDSRKLNEVTMKRKAKMPNMEELISRISKSISEGKEGEILAIKLDSDYAYEQLKLDEKTKNLCIFTVTGGDFTGYYRFLKGFYGQAHTNIFSRTDRHDT